jgi:hypothetical protein
MQTLSFHLRKRGKDGIAAQREHGLAVRATQVH